MIFSQIYLFEYAVIIGRFFSVSCEMSYIPRFSSLIIFSLVRWDGFILESKLNLSSQYTGEKFTGKVSTK